MGNERASAKPSHQRGCMCYREDLESCNFSPDFLGPAMTPAPATLDPRVLIAALDARTGSGRGPGSSPSLKLVAGQIASAE